LRAFQVVLALFSPFLLFLSHTHCAGAKRGKRDKFDGVNPSSAAFELDELMCTSSGGGQRERTAQM
jgi:hypothetical protein